MQGEVAVVVVAAGRGTRVGGDAPKQYRPLHGAPVISHTLRLFASHPQVAMVQPVIHRDDIARFDAAAEGLALREAVFGGATRQISVRAGLEALERDRPRIVLVHDAARPFASPALRSALRLAVRASGRPRRRKSERAVTRDILDWLATDCRSDGLVDIRDLAIRMVAFASGGRRRSEVAPFGSISSTTNHPFLPIRSTRRQGPCPASRSGSDRVLHIADIRTASDEAGRTRYHAIPDDTRIFVAAFAGAQQITFANHSHELSCAINHRHRADAVLQQQANHFVDQSILGNRNYFRRHDVFCLHGSILSGWS